MVCGKAASTRRKAPREKNFSVSGALSNRMHGLYHIRYFENRATSGTRVLQSINRGKKYRLTITY